MARPAVRPIMHMSNVAVEVAARWLPAQQWAKTDSPNANAPKHIWKTSTQTAKSCGAFSSLAAG
eukprot:6999748-Alexandrium_andersonii.AAC.1